MADDNADDNAKEPNKNGDAGSPPERPRDENRADLITLLRNWQIFAIGLGLILVGVVLSELLMNHWEYSVFLSPKTYAEFFKDIGFAAVIAFMVSFAVERAARREFADLIRLRIEEFTDLVHRHRGDFTANVHEQINSIKTEMFRATFGRSFTREYISEIERVIFGANFLRHRHRQIYTLKFLRTADLDPDPRDAALPDIALMRCEVSMSYEVENIANTPQDFSVRLELEKPTFKPLIQFVRIRRVAINDKDMLPDQLQCADRDCPDTEDFRCFEHVVKDVPPGGQVRVQANWEFLKDANDVELWRSIYPSDGMTLGVNFPNEVKAKGAHAAHRVILTTKEVEGMNYYEWSIDKPVLPHQGIVFWWRTSDPPALKLATPPFGEAAPAQSIPPSETPPGSGTGT